MELACSTAPMTNPPVLQLGAGQIVILIVDGGAIGTNVSIAAGRP